MLSSVIFETNILNITFISKIRNIKRKNHKDTKKTGLRNQDIRVMGTLEKYGFGSQDKRLVSMLV